MRQKATLPPIKNEAQNGLRNLRGTIAMARMSDPDSASSQFFINLADNRFLDHGTRDFGYAVFGEVTAGMDVVDAIAAVKTLPGDQPAEPVILQNIEVIQEATTTSVAK
jgi:peptidyl-prolyl cis-trans isomerase A (cyclophilin A)